MERIGGFSPFLKMSAQKFVHTAGLNANHGRGEGLSPCSYLLPYHAIISRITAFWVWLTFSLSYSPILSAALAFASLQRSCDACRWRACGCVHVSLTWSAVHLPPCSDSICVSDVAAVLFVIRGLLSLSKQWRGQKEKMWLLSIRFPRFLHFFVIYLI